LTEQQEAKEEAPGTVGRGSDLHVVDAVFGADLDDAINVRVARFDELFATTGEERLEP
jgi:hypothetical protein